jgi:hypothetical protein
VNSDLKSGKASPFTKSTKQLDNNFKITTFEPGSFTKPTSPFTKSTSIVNNNFKITTFEPSSFVKKESKDDENTNQSFKVQTKTFSSGLKLTEYLPKSGNSD